MPRHKKIAPEERPYLTYEDLKKRDPIDYYARKWLISQEKIIEILGMCERDFRFFSPRTTYVEYEKVSKFVKTFFNVQISPRQIRYLHRTYKNHRILMEKLKRGGKIMGTYRDLVLKKA